MIAITLQRLFAPLTLAMENRAVALVLLEDLGWTLDEQFQLDAFEPLAPVMTEIGNLATLIEDYDKGDAELGYVVEQAVILGETVYTAIEGLRDLTDGDVTHLVAPMNRADFWEELALDLPEYLILTYLETYLPLVYATLDFAGVFGEEPRSDPPARHGARSCGMSWAICYPIRPGRSGRPTIGVGSWSMCC